MDRMILTGRTLDDKMHRRFHSKRCIKCQKLELQPKTRRWHPSISTLFSLRTESSMVDTTHWTPKPRIPPPLEGSFLRGNDGFGWQQCMQRNRNVERAWPCINKSRSLLTKKATDREISNPKQPEATLFKVLIDLIIHPALLFPPLLLRRESVS